MAITAVLPNPWCIFEFAAICSVAANPAIIDIKHTKRSSFCIWRLCYEREQRAVSPSQLLFYIIYRGSIWCLASHSFLSRRFCFIVMLEIPVTSWLFLVISYLVEVKQQGNGCRYVHEILEYLIFSTKELFFVQSSFFPKETWGTVVAISLFCLFGFVTGSCEPQSCLHTVGRAHRDFLSPTLLCSPALVSQVEALKEENDSLRWQLDAYRNEVELLKQEHGKASRDEDTTKEQQLKLLQQALQGMQQVGLGFSIAVALLERQRGCHAKHGHKQRHFVNFTGKWEQLSVISGIAKK